MQIPNSRDAYGLVAVALHWLVAAVVVALFALGLSVEGIRQDG